MAAHWPSDLRRVGRSECLLPIQWTPRACWAGQLLDKSGMPVRGKKSFAAGRLLAEGNIHKVQQGGARHPRRVDARKVDECCADSLSTGHRLVAGVWPQWPYSPEKGRLGAWRSGSDLLSQEEWRARA